MIGISGVCQNKHVSFEQQKCIYEICIKHSRKLSYVDNCLDVNMNYNEYNKIQQNTV